MSEANGSVAPHGIDFGCRDGDVRAPLQQGSAIACDDIVTAPSAWPMGELSTLCELIDFMESLH